MVRKDLADAGIPYSVDGPNGPLFADFHALRHTYLTELLRNGVDLRTAQLLAGHGTPTQTARYSHRGFEDLSKVVQKMPGFLPSVLVYPRLTQTGDIPGQLLAVEVNEGGSQQGDPETKKPPISQGFRQRQAVPDSPIQERGRRGSNPQPPERQSGALTN